MVETLFLLLAGHALCDYPLQGDWLSKAKNPNLELVPGETIWPLALTSHVLIHSAMVYLITGMWVLAVLEFCTHWFIDHEKCKGRFGYNTDQYLHIFCKVVWATVWLGFSLQ